MQRSYSTMIIVGFVSIAISFLIYSRYGYDAAITPNAIPFLERLAVGMYLVLFLSFGAIAYGLYRFYKAKIVQSDRSFLQ